MIAWNNKDKSLVGVFGPCPPVPVFAGETLAMVLGAVLDPDEKVVEIDRFNVGLGEELAKLSDSQLKLCQLLPERYVSKIEKLGLILSSENRRRANTVIGQEDSDLLIRSSPLQLWRGAPITTRKIRSVDTLFEDDGGVALIIMNGETATDTLMGASRLLRNRGPLIAIRLSATFDSMSLLSLLRTFSDYEWIDCPLICRTTCTVSRSHQYAIAAASNWRARLADEGRTNVGLLLHLDRMYVSDPTKGARLIFEPSEFVATEGLYAAEQLDDTIWRWGGNGNRLSFLLEPRLIGHCRGQLSIINNMPGAIEALNSLAVNGRPTQVHVAPHKIEFDMMLETPFVLQIGCDVTTPADGNTRPLNLALGRLELQLDGL